MCGSLLSLIARDGWLIWRGPQTHERGEKLGVYYAAPLLGPSIGPLLGGAITSASSWRSTFYFLVAVSCGHSLPPADTRLTLACHSDFSMAASVGCSRCFCPTRFDANAQ